MSLARSISLTGLLLCADLAVMALPVTAYSDYEFYLSEGIKSFRRYDDERAARYFERAKSANPSSTEPERYLQLIRERTYRPSAQQVDCQDPQAVRKFSYDDLLDTGREALDAKQVPYALSCFYKAHIVDDQRPEALDYINLVYRIKADQVQPGQVPPRQPRGLPEGGLPKEAPAARTTFQPERQEAVNTALNQIAAAREKKSEQLPSYDAPAVQVSPRQPQPPREAGQDRLEQRAGAVVRLGDLPPEGATIAVEFGSFVVVEGRNIRRFLVLDPTIFEGALINRDQLRVTAKKLGRTHIHIWDENGRWTLNVLVVLPPPTGPRVADFETTGIERGQPFRIFYSSDWSGYYEGPSVKDMHRQSRFIEQRAGFEGDIPWGFLDASGTVYGYRSLDEDPRYTVGLSNAPVPGTTDFDIRVFDAWRRLTPLTMPGTVLRGVSVDSRVLSDAVGISVSHGRQLPSYGILSGLSADTDVYVNAVRLVLFPMSDRGWLAFNYAHGYGEDREAYLAENVYSIQGKYRIDKTTLNAELASDENNTASTGGARYDSGGFSTGIQARSINKNYTTVVSLPGNQGEVGATWVTDFEAGKLRAGTAVDMYKDRLYPNPDDPDAVNADTSGYFRVPITETVSTDTSVRYVNTPGEVSPRRSGSVDTRLSKSFETVGGRYWTVYVGGGYQRSRYAYADEFDFDRTSAIVGLQYPLTRHLSTFANFEQSQVEEPGTGETYHPNVLNAGVSYTKEFTQKVSGTLGVTYRNEENVEGLNSFLAGEDSVSAFSSLSYTPVEDVAFFVDGRIRDVQPEIATNSSYNDMDLRFGVRAAWGTGLRWDPKGVIEGFVFKDRNNNGRKDSNEQGLPNVVIVAGPHEATTDEAGRYSVRVQAKRVLVSPKAESLPRGFIYSTSPSQKVSIRHGHTNIVNFGLSSQSGIYGVAFVDRNANGKPDRGDTFVGRVKVLLDGKTYASTDSRGAYFFNNIAEGRHTLAIDMRSLRKGLIPLVKVRNSIDVKEGTTYVFHIPLKESARQ